MQKACLYSLLLIVVLTGLAADRSPDTAAEFYPLASAIGWVGGEGRDLKTELTGSGIQPPHVVKIGRALIPETPPAMMLHYGAVTRIFSEVVGREIDGNDFPLLSWWVNFMGVLPWVLLLFTGLYTLAGRWGCEEPANRLWGAWAAIFGSLGAGWMGTFSPWLPVSALAVWVVVLFLKNTEKINPIGLGLAGLLAGISGAAHPSGWIWILVGAFYLFVLMADQSKRSILLKSIILFVTGAVIGILISVTGNYLFFGTPLPVSLSDRIPLPFGPGSVCWLLRGTILWAGTEFSGCRRLS